MNANRQLWHCSWMFKYGSKHDVHVMDFASEPVPKVIYNQAGIWSLFRSSVIELVFLGMMAKKKKKIYFFIQDSPQTSFVSASRFKYYHFKLKGWYSVSNDQLKSSKPRACFQKWLLLQSLPKVNIQLSCAKEISQIMAGWYIQVDSSLCLDKRNTKSFWLQAASRLLSLFSS